MDKKETKVSTGRRTFFKKSANTLIYVSVGNAGLYAVGSLIKKLDGSLVAGAK